ncbi:tetratricopeptide repeat protein [Mesorhizobium sp. RP14(2022)]|uniref:Tetratricopeptide repeat protein n=1 Tax=Mesorhizobium liriopis TaxID=2953882 RepID=A0ABT1C0Y5_9HYPH|nr:tetratricopeptide repeat protein [Mesorhizobium liriopis]MCO6048498.1 tetratricopeptide repeat protein [Mesorhizobium liriopis]
MSNDTFIREVNEEIRQERAKALWTRFGPVAIALAVLVVLGTAAWVAYEHFANQRANASGDRFSQALTLANTNKPDEALAAFKALEEDGYGNYPVLARLRSATVLAQKADFAGAVAAFDAVAADTAVPQVLQDAARLRAALLLVDHGSYADVASRAEALSTDDNPFRHSAREALGLSAWKENRAADALKLFDQIKDDQQAPNGARQRATMMGDLIRSSGSAS